jgi:hypothetical protein
VNEIETGKILSVITEIYPSFKKDRDIGATAAVWQQLFAQVPYDTVSRALMNYSATDTKGFPPVPGAINEQIGRMMEAEGLSESEAWCLVYKAVCRGIYNSREEFEKLPPVIRDIVGNPNELHHWAQSEERYVKDSVCSWFLRAYNSSMEKDRKDALIPPGACFALPESAAEEDG